MSKKKQQLDEGRIKDWIDKIFYWVLEKRRNKVIEKLKNDPKLDRHLSEFEEKMTEMEKILEDFFNNPENFDVNDNDNK